MDCERIREHLEAYALGALEPAEQAEVERHLATCAECRREAGALAEVVALFPEALTAASPMSPPSEIRERVLEAASTHAALPQHRSFNANARGSEPVPPAPTRTVRRPHHPLRLIAFGVPVFLLVFSLIWGIRLADALDRERSLKTEYVELLDEVVGEQELVFEVIGFDDTNRQFLRAQQADSTSYGKLFTRPDMPYVVVMAGRLPPAPAGSTFHVWVTSNGQTALAGELTVDDQGFGLLVFTTEQPGPTYETAFVTLQAPGESSPAGAEILRHEPSGVS